MTKEVISNDDSGVTGITVEEISDSEADIIHDNDSQDYNGDRNNSVSTVSLDMSRTAAPPVFGSVSVNHSENVHFGNNTYFNGPVTIKQLVQTDPGVNNPAYIPTEDEFVKSTVNKNVDRKRDEEFCVKMKLWHKLALITAFTVTFGVICLAILLSRSNEPLDNQSTLSDNEEDPLQVAPFHLRLVPRTDWLAQPVEGKLDDLKLPAPWVIISHSATEQCHTQSECVLRVRLIQAFHIESRGWFDIGYNFLVGGDGSAYVGRGWDYVGAHTKGYNNISIGINFIGTFNHIDPPAKQVEACQKLLAMGEKLGKLTPDYKLFAHRQLWSTLSPGDKVYNIIKQWPHFENNVTESLPAT